MVRDYDQEHIDEKMQNLKLLVFKDQLEEHNDPTVKERTDIIFLGNIELDGEIKSLYEIIKETKDGTIKELYLDNLKDLNELECIGREMDNGEFALTEKYFDKEILIKEINSLDKEQQISLKEYELIEDKLEYLALELGINKEDIKEMVELDADQEIYQEINEIEEKDEKEEDKDKIQEKDTKQIINGKQEIDLNDRGNDVKSIGQMMGLSNEYVKIVIVESRDVKNVQKDAKINRTRYNVVAIDKNGRAKVLDGEKGILEVDHSQGDNPTKEAMLRDENGTLREDSTINSIYRVKGKNDTMAIKNGKYGEIEVYYGGKTKGMGDLEGNQFIGTKLETSNVYPMSRKVLEEDRNEHRSEYELEENALEGKKHLDQGEKELSQTDSNGEPDKTHEHNEEQETVKNDNNAIIDKMVEEIMQDDIVSEAFSEREVREIVKSDLENNKGNKTQEELTKEIKDDLSKTGFQWIHSRGAMDSNT